MKFRLILIIFLMLVTLIFMLFKNNISPITSWTSTESSFNVSINIKDNLIYVDDDLTAQVKNLIYVDDALTAQVILNNEGTEPVKVGLKYLIFDGLGNELYSEKEFLVVETKTVFVKKFSLDLKPSVYSLVLRASPNREPEKEIKEEFRIEDKNIKYVYYLASVLLIFMIIYCLFLIFKERREYC